MNDELNEEIKEIKKLLEEYSNELDKSYSSDNTKSQKNKELEQKIIVLEKEKKELEKKKDIEIKMNNTNNELSHAVNLF